MSVPWVEQLRPCPQPWEAFVRLSELPYVLFLDTARADSGARYSFLSACPFQFFRASENGTHIATAEDDRLEGAGYTSHSSREDPIATLAQAIRSFPTPAATDLPPFQGGAAGVLGYGLGRHLERVAAPRWDEFRLPDMCMGLYDWVIAFDHQERTGYLISQGLPAVGAARQERARTRAAAVLELLRGEATPVHHSTPALPSSADVPLEKLAPSFPLDDHPDLLSNFRRNEYLDAVARSIEYIRAGDVFQVNLSQRLLHPALESPRELYSRLRRENPAPFAGYFDAGSLVVASSSPEQFLSVAGREVITRPIKGTHPRGYTPLADAYGRDALFESDKNRSENVMIVDLMRNDISRVCEPHTVKVPSLFELEGHPTVHHLVSEVRGTLRDEHDVFDLLRATFPGGSITGAPKVRAMEIIQELEPTARGPYCGSMGWIGYDGAMQLNILIRTMTITGGWIQFPVGGGIVVDSHPESEYQETLHKAAGMVRALKRSPEEPPATP